MRVREYLTQERGKLRQISGMRKKAEYIWEYYQLWILGILGAVALMCYVLFRMTTTLSENWVYVMFTNTRQELGNGSELWDGYVEYTGYDTSVKNVEFNASSYFDYGAGCSGNSYYEAFVAYTDTGTLDALTMDDESLTELGAGGRLMDLNSDACAEIREKYGDRFIYCTSNNEEDGDEPIAVGIDVSDSILMTEYHIYSDTCAVGIGAYSEHPEAVLAFLDYICEET